MALWPFGKKKTEQQEADHPADTRGADAAAAPATAAEEAPTADTAGAASSANVAHSFAHDPVNGQSGPFDGDAVDIGGFDFSDFSVGILDLGSMKIALPQGSGVTVDANENGPQQLRIVTEHGSIIPVAFAATRKPGLWAQNAEESLKGLSGEGLPARFEEGPWGTEVVSQRPEGTIRIIGIEGSRWMLRLTLAAPAGKEEAMAQLGREVAARTFVYRGDQPILAGTSLPVTLPEQLVPLLQERMRQMQEQQAADAAQKTPADASADAAAEAAARMREVHGAGDSGNPGDARDGEGR